MTEMRQAIEASVQQKFNTYPTEIKQKLLAVRELILTVAESENCGEVSESLKWGQPSYQCQSGSPIRIDWVEQQPAYISVFFNCNSKLVATFREIFPHSLHLQFIGNRELRCAINQALPIEELKVCFLLALRYHQLKRLPLLGR